MCTVPTFKKLKTSLILETNESTKKVRQDYEYVF